ncbi:MAG: valine--tRNA ligase [Rickettsiales bacterium]|nr:valine--tRNA ligase [Pseudomonadota bacterium]MDA0966149.1 valine--tRNA ligase [Pseudomonadota bacterium]MDG4543186.1 valine--tRNA ligase [Rickettsiales bacterium]MDG4545384.1 valine--tRNA ligase [Rickettsiales bacterium]MDG4547833.1 valine--tRNA ligase [Rickettsiales bacterium]
MKPLPNKYDHKETESRWQKAWEENKVYAWDESQPRENTYVIDTPPPTVSGLLHMGHVFSYSQADFIARYQRMKGKTVFYPMGFDDNGLPTERLVEKVKKVRPTDMSREDFIKLCEGVSEEARKEFRKLFEEIALSVDWKQEYHTISEDSRKISQLSFLDLFNKERAYRKLQPMLWDPVDQTAIAQAEIEDKEMPSQKNYIHFGLEGDESRNLEIMTTRPELLGACVAVIYNPNDERYKDLEGKQAITPVFGVKVPIIADEKVDMEKGTGLVMCCTFGDETDIAWWREHDLPTRMLLNKYGKIIEANFVYSDDLQTSDESISLIYFPNEGSSVRSTESDAHGANYRDNITKNNCDNLSKTAKAFRKIQGLKSRTTAREKMLELLAEEGAIFKEPEITVHAEPCAERSGSPLEILPTNQWFVKILDQKEELKKKAEECNWYPEFMKVRIDQWIDGLSWDWCISRQRYFGVPFPVWYSKRAGEEGKIIIAEPDQLPVNPLVDLPKGYSREEVEAEADVMDTWATSSVSPQLSSRGINAGEFPLHEGERAREQGSLVLDANRHKKLFPADLRPQAHEIIRTWAFYTIVKAHLHEDTIPWKNLMISGWCLASDKTKMSKSKGNVVTPVDLIEEKGSDVVRFWASTSRLGADTAYSEDVLKIGKKLVTKLWNATKFAAIHLDKLTQKPSTAKADVESGIINEPLDLWILTRLNKTIKKSTEQFDKYEYCNARTATEDFFWNDFCDNYLELVKTRVYGEAEGTTKEGQQSAVHTIYHCLDGILRLFAPIIPHITEELYAHIFDDKIEEFGGSIHARGTWLNYEDYPVDEAAEESGIACVSILDAVRKMKAERNVSIKWPLNFIAISNDDVKEKIRPLTEDLKNVTNSSEIIFGEQVTKDGQGQTIETTNGYKITAEFATENSDAA